MWHSTNRPPCPADGSYWCLTSRDQQQCSVLDRCNPPFPLQPVTCVQLACFFFLMTVDIAFSLVYFLQSALESKLSQLFKHLHGMRQTLSLILAPQQEPDNPAAHKAPAAVYARLLNQTHHCCTILDRCCLDLLTLSLIVPSAPWVSGSSSRSLSLPFLIRIICCPIVRSKLQRVLGIQGDAKVVLVLETDTFALEN